MPRQGNGNYVLPADNPVAPMTTIRSSWANNTMNDVAQALTQSIASDGQTAPTANLPMAGFNHTTVGPAVTGTQYARADQIQTNALSTLTGAAMATANVYTANLALAQSTFTVGQVVYLIPPATNTGASTLNVNATGAVPIQNMNGGAVAAGALVTGVIMPLWWAGAAWRILNANAAGSNKQVQFNDNGALAGDPGFVYDKVSKNVGLGAIPSPWAVTDTVIDFGASGNIRGTLNTSELGCNLYFDGTPGWKYKANGSAARVYMNNFSTGGTLKMAVAPNGAANAVATLTDVFYIDANGLSVTNNATFNGGIAIRGANTPAATTGKGLEFSFTGTNNLIRSYDRDTPAWLPIQCNASLHTLGSGTGGAVPIVLVNGSGLSVGAEGVAATSPIGTFDAKTAANWHMLVAHVNGRASLGNCNDGLAAWLNLALGGGGSAVIPSYDNTTALGAASTFRWSNIYTVNAVTVGSDVRMKKDIRPSELGLDFINSLNPVSYKWITEKNVVKRVPDTEKTDGTDYKDEVIPIPGFTPHWGLIAQDVQAALAATGVTGQNGIVVQEDEQDMMGLRYGEFIAPLIAAVKELSARVVKLEAQLAAKP